MLDLIIAQCQKLLNKKTEFSGTYPKEIILMIGDQQVFDAFELALQIHEQNTRYSVLDVEPENHESINQEYDASRPKGWIIPFLCKIEFKLNSDIVGYTLTKIN